MGQVTIYLDDENERRLRRAAADAGVPVSRWLANLVEEKTRQEWPESVREMAGEWRDFPSIEELRGSLVEDSEREPL
ncbi:CopG family transcriptional regulator [Methylonatrum kenyense]|uniref:CopG family transcriptional regulator n=1 Tax=Methylonatrum kenyense TaxID=455253 RepID=UPI0020C0BBFA|nr:CopG family transcriptional regulator [Methylonatrum kenyense]MCK8516982.1 CopG family transcriptional regulator [Methylonatrum kenyense]